MSIVDSTKLKVQSYLIKLGNPALDEDGDLSLQSGSARVFVRVNAMGDDQSIVEIFCYALSKVPVTPALYEYVATKNNYRFGKLSLVVMDDGTGRVMVGHTLLGTYLDPDELLIAVSLVADLADNLDDEMKAKFGGERFHES